MDFIDEFIEEYKNNPCLWKTDSVNFKNRTKRQEAYFQLIKVASKHGEHYNIERTKQKINNLRCAFRHQLKKYIEFREKEKDEPYCPKRKYFESLMFLKDEENIDRKNGRDPLCKLTKNVNATAANTINLSVSAAQVDQSSFRFDFNKSTSYTTEVEDSNVDKNSNSFIFQNVDGQVTKQDIEKSADFASESPGPLETNCKNTAKVTADNIICTAPEGQQRERKRSSSLPSQLLNDGDILPSKHLKIDFSGIDIKNLLSLACKNVDNNLDDNFSNFGKIVAHKLRTMQPLQAIYAEKIIGDVIYHGQLKLLSSSQVNYFVTMNPDNL